MIDGCRRESSAVLICDQPFPLLPAASVPPRVSLDQFMVSWREFFAALARVRFVGPNPIEVRYKTKDEINTFRHDLDFVRKQVAAA
jgi:hypothetical protein